MQGSLENYGMFIYTHLFPKSWFKATMPGTKKFNNGYEGYWWENVHYWKPGVIANVAYKERVAALNSLKTAKQNNQKHATRLAALKLWYVSHADMTFDSNIKMSLRNILMSNVPADTTNGVPHLTTVQALKIIFLLIPKEILMRLIATVAIAVVETLKFCLSWIYHLIVKPIYYLVYKDLFCKNKLSVAEMNIIDEVRANTLKNYFCSGVLMPVFRGLKLIVLPYGLLYGMIRGVYDIHVALHLAKMFNAEVYDVEKKIEHESSAVMALKACSYVRAIVTAPRTTLLTMYQNKMRRDSATATATATEPSSPVRRSSSFEFDMRETSSGSSPKHVQLA